MEDNCLFKFVKKPGRTAYKCHIYMELQLKPEILTSYIYGPTFGNAESRLFLFAAQRFNTESMQKVILWHISV
jgi:hypothetical protein